MRKFQLFCHHRLFRIGFIFVYFIILYLIYFSFKNYVTISSSLRDRLDFHGGSVEMIGLLDFPERINPCDIKSRNFTSNSSEVGAFQSTRISRNRCIEALDPILPSLTIQCPSRLGNQMFSYAILFAIASYNNFTANMSPFMSGFISKYFQVSMDTLDNQVYDSTPWITQLLPAVVPPNIRHLAKTDEKGLPSRIKFCCYPQTWRYFNELNAKIRAEFKFHPEIQLHAIEELNRARQKVYPNLPTDVTFIGIHVRRGDFLTEQQNKRFRHSPSVEYYEGAMNYFIERVNVNNPIFVVASDDILWCRQNFANLSNHMKIHFLDNTTVADGGWDMAILSNCNHMIFGLGTFGFWAGYLNPGQVVYCDDCVVKGDVWMEDGLVYGGNYDNFVLPSWKGIRWDGTI